MHRNKVLIVEDNTTWQDILEDVARDNDLTPLVAATVEEATQLFDKHHDTIACITMDGGLLEDLDTIPLIERFSKYCPIVGVTGSDSLVQEKMQEAGCSLVFAKQTLERTKLNNTVMVLTNAQPA